MPSSRGDCRAYAIACKEEPAWRVLFARDRLMLPTVLPSLRGAPGRVGVVRDHRLGNLGGFVAKVFFQYDAVLIHDESFDARGAILRGPRHKSEAAEHQALLNVIMCSARREEALRFEDLVV